MSDLQWMAGMVECTSCWYRCVSVRPVEAITGLECPKCGRMRMVEVIVEKGKQS